MKLKKFDSTNTGLPGKVYYRIRLSRKGASCISSGAVELLGLKAGDRIAIHQDEERPKDWYIEKDKNGFKLRSEKGRTAKALYFNKAAIANSVLDSIGATEISFTFKMALEPTIEDGKTLYAIFTSDYKNKSVIEVDRE